MTTKFGLPQGVSLTPNGRRGKEHRETEPREARLFRCGHVGLSILRFGNPKGPLFIRIEGLRTRIHEPQERNDRQGRFWLSRRTSRPGLRSPPPFPTTQDSLNRELFDANESASSDPSRPASMLGSVADSSKREPPSRPPSPQDSPPFRWFTAKLRRVGTARRSRWPW